MSLIKSIRSLLLLSILAVGALATTQADIDALLAQTAAKGRP
jgi:hypothetical protein